MSPKTKLQIAELSDLTIGELTAKYEKLFGEKCRSRARSAAYATQASMFSGFGWGSFKACLSEYSCRQIDEHDRDRRSGAGHSALNVTNESQR